MGLAIQYGNVIISLMVAHLLASILAAEARNLRLATFALIIQSTLLASIFASFAYLWKNHWIYYWALTALFTKAIIIPWLLFIYIRRFPEREVRPLLGFRINLLLVIIFLLIFFRFIHTYIEFIAPRSLAMMEPARTNLAIAFTIFVLGIYVCIFRRDAIKIIIGIVLLENGAHLSLVTLAPELPETTIWGITTNVVVAVILLLYLSGGIYKALGTTDTAELSELKR